MKNLFLLLFIAILATSCNSNASSTAESAAALKVVQAKIEELKNSNSLEANDVKQLINAIDGFVAEYKTDAKAPELLEMKAKYLSVLGLHKQAFITYQQIFKEYQSYKNYSDALFMMAFITENDLQDIINAEILYKKYIQEFPEGAFYKDAVFSLENINKTPEELNEMLKKMNEATESNPL